MAIPHTRVSTLLGAVDPRVYGKCFCTKPFYRRLIFKHIDYGILKKNEWHNNSKQVPLLIYLISLGRIIHENKLEMAVESMSEHTLALAAAEIVGSDILKIPDDSTDPMNCAKARTIFSLAVHAVIQNDGMYAITTSSDQLFEDYLIQTHVNTPDIRYHMASLKERRMPFETAYLMALHMIDCLLPPYETTYPQLLAYSYCTILQNGNLTQSFCKDASQSIQVELNQNVTLQLECMKIFYNSFCNQNVRQNSERALTSLFACMPGDTLGLRHAVRKIDYPNLISLNTVGRALKLFGNFKWNIVRSFYSSEWAAFANTVKVVGNSPDPRQIQNIDASSYKTITWISKELLIRIGDEKILHWYSDLSQLPDQFELASGLLKDYDENRHSLPFNLDEEVTRVLKMVVRYDKVYN